MVFVMSSFLDNIAAALDRWSDGSLVVPCARSRRLPGRSGRCVECRRLRQRHRRHHDHDDVDFGSSAVRSIPCVRSRSRGVAGVRHSGLPAAAAVFTDPEESFAARACGLGAARRRRLGAGLRSRRERRREHAVSGDRGRFPGDRRGRALGAGREHPVTPTGLAGFACGAQGQPVSSLPRGVARR